MARRRHPRPEPAPHPFEEAVGRLVRTQGLFRDGDRVVVALSAGPDSTALLLALHALSRGDGPRARLVAAHLDHGLRPGSAADARAARATARRLRIPFRTARLRGLRGRAAGSLEAAARRERYAFLARVAVREGARAVAVGHHRDDRVETVLHRLLQGAALGGLAGIPLRRPLPGAPGCSVIRPLHDLDRAAVLAYLGDRGEPFREDPTNRDGSNARARLRRTILPALLRAYPHARTSLLRLEGQAREAVEALDRGSAGDGVRVRRGVARLPRGAFAGRGSEGVRRLLAALLAALGEAAPARAAVERTRAALESADGRERRVPVRGGVEVAVGREEVKVSSSRAPRPSAASRSSGPRPRRASRP